MRNLNKNDPPVAAGRLEMEGNMEKKKIAAKLLLYMAAGMLAGCGAGKEEAMNMDGGKVMNGSAPGAGKDSLATEGASSGTREDTGGEWTTDRLEAADGMLMGEPAEAPMPGGMDGEVSPDRFAETEAPEDVFPGEIDTEYFPEVTVPPKAGLLTAGEWRDNENWGFFTNLVQTGRFRFETFGIAPYERVVVQALADGEPVGQVKVDLCTVSGSAIAKGVTDHDGKVYLYYNIYGGSDEPDHIILTKPDGSEVTASLNELGQEVRPGLEPNQKEQQETIPEDEAADGQALEQQNGQGQSGGNRILRSTELTVELGETARAVKALDVMFVFDTTGSMGDELLYLQKEFEDIAGRVADQSTRFSVNFYRDQGDEYVVRSHPFMEGIKEVSALINAEYANGGGDYEEAVDKALLDAVTGHTWRDTAVKLLFLILDAPPHDTQETAQNLRMVLSEASAQGIRIIPIASSGVDEKTEGFLRSMAMATGGTYTFLTDDSGIGNSHLEPTIGSYTVEALNDLIVRLIKEYYGE